ncbi:MAG: GDP-L-fucose synthase [Gammaproteobacteria bacterium]|nr:GDP-L-fucose synthase [Gammaproteobacteria bacterium]
MNQNAKIFVAGHGGMVGSALVRCLQQRGFRNLLRRTRQQLDLLNQPQVYRFMEQERPDYVFLAAAKVGGIHANNVLRADFIYQNLMIETNVIHAAFKAGVSRLMFLGSSCIYPRDCPQPIKEEYLLTGPLEVTNEPYAVAKIAGIKLCESFNRQYGTHYVAVMPTNLYGPNDNFDLATSHVLPALLRKMHEARLRADPAVTIWGSGQARREFLYVDDLAEACVFLMERDVSDDMLNIGCGEDLRISELAEAIREVVGFTGEFRFDTSMPDGTPRKLLDLGRITTLGWQPRYRLRDGLQRTYEWYLQQDAAVIPAPLVMQEGKTATK